MSLRPGTCQLDTVLNLVSNNIDDRSLGFLGEKGVNVLGLNIALDKVTG